MDILNNFINSLHEKINKRSELVLYIADVLCIEREPANRRLSGKVPFTIHEMGKLSQKLGISLDSLMKNRSVNVLPNLKMKIPMSGHFEDMITHLEYEARKLEEFCAEPIELATAFSSMPLEFFMPYPSLEKFMYYKWEYFQVGSNEYDNYSSWEIPERLKKINQQFMKISTKFSNRLYIWNPVTVFCMTKEIKYFKNIHAINERDINIIKADLHDMLDDIENQAGMRKTDSDRKIEIYVSFINHGLNFSSFKTENKFYITFDSYFIGLDSFDNHESFVNIQEWITSMKKISTLISGSGAIERRLFFQEQHKYVRDI